MNCVLDVRLKTKNKSKAFTVIELIVVITIMGIMVGLGVVNFRSTQINSRDTERKTDIEMISQHLDIYYTSGYTSKAGSSVDATFSYPSTLKLIGDPADVSNMIEILRDIDQTALKAPNIDNPVEAFIPATNSVQTTSSASPRPTIDQYVYQPIKSDGSLCTAIDDECRKYNLYYRLEENSTVYILRSKYQ